MEKSSPLHNGDENQRMKVLKVHDIEDNIWSPKYGLKGKVDVTALVQIHDYRSKPQNKVLPLELKTGKASFSAEHQAQVAMYTMMMDNRLRKECDGGLLLYLKDGPQMCSVDLNDNSKRAIINRRNEAALNSARWETGPDFKDSAQFCPKCDHLVDCLLHAKYFEAEKLQRSKGLSLKFRLHNLHQISRQ